MSPNEIYVTETEAEVLELSETEAIIVETEVVSVIEAGDSGPQGPQGIQGTPGVSTGTFTREVPAGTIDGVNDVFTIDHIPSQGTLMLYLNGLAQLEDEDYSLDDAEVTFVLPPEIGDTILATYLH